MKNYVLKTKDDKYFIKKIKSWYFQHLVSPDITRAKTFTEKGAKKFLLEHPFCPFVIINNK